MIFPIFDMLILLEKLIVCMTFMAQMARPADHSLNMIKLPLIQTKFHVKNIILHITEVRETYCTCVECFFSNCFFRFQQIYINYI